MTGVMGPAHGAGRGEPPGFAFHRLTPFRHPAAERRGGALAVQVVVIGVKERKRLFLGGEELER